MVPLPLSRLPLNTTGRDFAVGDIHGSFTALQTTLDQIGFDPAGDRLISVGDLVDRGPESDAVLDWLARPWFHAIGGNHDFMVWRAALGDPFTQVDFREHGGRWLDALPADTQQRIGEALRALPLALEVQTPTGLIGIVHADCPSHDWADLHGDLPDWAADVCLWSRERFMNQDETPVAGVRAVIHGHTTLKAPVVLGNAHFIDTGGWAPGGYFTLLELATLQMHRGAVLTPRRVSRWSLF